MNWQRISALIIRYSILYKRNISRLFDIFFWPILDLVLWGFVSLYIVQSAADVPRFILFFIGAFILWDVLFRSSLGITTSFLEDLWTRNFLNVFASPLKPGEFIVATVLSSIARVLVSATVMIAFALIAYHFNFFTLGPAVVAFFVNLFIMGWSIGIVATAIILRFGQSAEIIAWGLPMLFTSFSSVYYPLEILPPAIQAISRFIPATHVFEGMRGLIATNTFSFSEFAQALGLNVLYLVISLFVFFKVFRNAKKSGRLVRTWQ